MSENSGQGTGRITLWAVEIFAAVIEEGSLSGAARRLGVGFDAARLTTDPEFNALLGAGYLAQMSQQFDGALPLIAAAYNAGPDRPRRWITEFGDPRDASVDPVEWSERIPFAETRNYVQRVLESLVIYRAILTGDRTIGLSDMLRGQG